MLRRRPRRGRSVSATDGDDGGCIDITGKMSRSRLFPFLITLRDTRNAYDTRFNGMGDSLWPVGYLRGFAFAPFLIGFVLDTLLFY
jgi:hypothetical protein